MDVVRKRPRSKAAQGLTKERIVAAALELIDLRGLPDFSVRELASSLGVYPTTLYWHVGPRDAILAEVVSLALADITPEAGGDWADWLRELFRRFRCAVASHPNIAPLIGAQMVSNAGIDLDLVERILAILTDAGFQEEALIGTYSAVIATMVGFVTLEFAPPPADEASGWAAGMEARLADVSAAEHPVLAANIDRLVNRALVVRWKPGTEAPLDCAFQAVTDTFVLGLRARLGR